MLLEKNMLNLEIDKDEFHADFFEKKMCFQKNAVEMNLINWNRISEILYGWDPSAGMKLFLNGLVPHGSYSCRYQDVDAIRNRLDREKFDIYLLSGATLVLNRIEERDRMLGALCMALSTFTGLKTVANGYVAFGGDGTFGKHWDTHDVFAVQLLGRKQWQVFEPTFALPLNFQKSKNFKHECPEVPIFDEILEAGDVLYIPRGWWHRAIPLENQETFHIAAGVHTAKVTDFVAWIVEQLLPEHLESRRSITPYSDHQKHISECLAMLNRVISDPVNMKMFIDKMQALNNVYEPVDFNSYKPRTNGSAQSLAFSMLRNSLSHHLPGE